MGFFFSIVLPSAFVVWIIFAISRELWEDKASERAEEARKVTPEYRRQQAKIREREQREKKEAEKSKDAVIQKSQGPMREFSLATQKWQKAQRVPFKLIPNGRKSKFTVYRIVIADKQYIGFTGRSLKARIREHHENASENIGNQNLYKYMRTWEFKYEYQEVATFNFEKDALHREMAEIAKIPEQQRLNMTSGGEGNRFILFFWPEEGEEKRIYGRERNQPKPISPIPFFQSLDEFEEFKLQPAISAIRMIERLGYTKGWLDD